MWCDTVSSWLSHNGKSGGPGTHFHLGEVRKIHESVFPNGTMSIPDGTLSLFVVLMTSVAVTSQSTVVQELQGKLDQLEDDLAKLSQYAMMQQFAAEERVRSEGYSGVNVIRGTEMGIFNYHSNSHVGNGMMAIHDHPNYFRTIGQGEIVAVLNGVSFRTRHNDYSLVMASPNSTEKHAVEDIPFPEVPPEVTNKLLVKVSPCGRLI
ncbi:uncharacterized protein LOC101848451 [Aplysia californica]|uniref:Uncharacterized protein LOC101848451 n=1 Tax=Aplysia californica TaxID=6500 RepID=A0ABM0JYH3_APLCA|nr:uncharacterized protein LOC101848451 [Aplysia californica]